MRLSRPIESCQYQNVSKNLVIFCLASAMLKKMRMTTEQTKIRLTTDEMREIRQLAEKCRIQQTALCSMFVSSALQAVRENNNTFPISGLPWPHNVTRHTFVSYHLAGGENAAKTALEAGHTEQMLFAHYRELVTPEAAAEFFAIFPSQRENDAGGTKNLRAVKQ